MTSNPKTGPGMTKANGRLGATSLVSLLFLSCWAPGPWMAIGHASASSGDVSFTGLGTLWGGLESEASAVSADGMVVVGASESAQGLRAFRWTPGEGMQDLGTLPGAACSEAFAVDADGDVVVGRSGERAFRWTPKEGMVALETLPDDSFSDARAVSADGSVIVGTIATNVEGANMAFRWSAEQGLEPLGVLPGQSWSGATGVSADGAVVVGASGPFAFRWTSGQGMVAVGEADVACWTFVTTGRAVSGDGDTVGGGVLSTYWGCSEGCDGACSVSSVAHAFRWTSVSGLVSIGTPTSWATPSVNAINHDGSRMAGASGSPCVWSGAGQLAFIHDRLAKCGIDLAGWDFTFNPFQPPTATATGISADGRTVVGGTLHNGLSEAWVATMGDPFVGATPADINGDGFVDAADLGLLLAAWGTDDPQADLSGDALVEGDDVGFLLGAWTG